MTTFTNANEVRRQIKEAGITDPVRISRGQSPFSGKTYFYVSLADIPKGTAVVTSFGSRQSVRFYSNDGGETAERLARLDDALKGTNARVES